MYEKVSNLGHALTMAIHTSDCNEPSVLLAAHVEAEREWQHASGTSLFSNAVFSDAVLVVRLQSLSTM